MKTLFKTMFVVAMSLIANIHICAATHQDNGLVRNAEEVNGVIVSETIFKMDDGMLTNYMKHNYKYDANNQRIEDEAMKLNNTKGSWDKDLCEDPGEAEQDPG